MELLHSCLHCEKMALIAAFSCCYTCGGRRDRRRDRELLGNFPFLNFRVVKIVRIEIVLVRETFKLQRRWYRIVYNIYIVPSITARVEMDWINCNSCFAQPTCRNDVTRFSLTTCGHIFCENCGCFALG